jgi:hypothetical protein
MPLCFLFASSRIVHLSQQSLKPTIEKHSHSQLYAQSCTSLSQTVRGHSHETSQVVPDFADRPYLHWSHTQIYIVHLIGSQFGFTLDGVYFHASEFLRHVKDYSKQCDRVIFASCLAFRDVWTKIADSMINVRVMERDRKVSMLVIAKRDVRKVLLDSHVLDWLAGLDWSRHSLGVEREGEVEKRNLKWRWLVL